MCHLPMKLSNMFDQHPFQTFDKIVVKHIPMKSPKLDFEPKSRGRSTNQKTMTSLGQKPCHLKTPSRGFLSNWRDAEQQSNPTSQSGGQAYVILIASAIDYLNLANH